MGVSEDQPTSTPSLIPSSVSFLHLSEDAFPDLFFTEENISAQEDKETLPRSQRGDQNPKCI